MLTDSELLRRYAETRSEEAFAELVRRHMDFVYAAALRRVGGDAHRAADVTQTVFVDLARKAPAVARVPVLAGWLYTSTRFAASRVLRGEGRRRAREQEAHMMHELSGEPAPEISWEDLRPVVDEALDVLDERDREAVLLRFFGGQTFAEIGEKFSLTDDAARLRVGRALDKMRAALDRRGVRSTAAALALALAGQPTVAAPASLAATVTGAALAGGSAAGAATAFAFMSTNKAVLGVAAALAAVGIGCGVYQMKKTREAEAALTALRGERAAHHVESQAARDRLTQAENEAAALRQRVEEPPSRSTSGAAAAGGLGIDQLKLLAEVQKQNWATIRMPIMTREGKLANGFSRVFGLSETEKSELQKVLDDGRQRITEMAAKNASVTRTDDSIVVSVKPFEGGAELYDTILDAFGRVLGPERNAAFMALEGEQLTTALNAFGAEDRTITLSRELPANGGEPLISIRDQKKMSRGISIDQSEHPKLPSQYEWLSPFATDLASLPPRPARSPEARKP